MTYLAHFDHPTLRHAYERPALCALEAAAIAVQHALRLRFPAHQNRLAAPPPSHSRIVAFIIIDRLHELLGTIDLYEQELSHEANRDSRRAP